MSYVFPIWKRLLFWNLEVAMMTTLLSHKALGQSLLKSPYEFSCHKAANLSTFLAVVMLAVTRWPRLAQQSPLCHPWLRQWLTLKTERNHNANFAVIDGPQVIIMTTCDAASDVKVGITVILQFLIFHFLFDTKADLLSFSWNLWKCISNIKIFFSLNYPTHSLLLYLPFAIDHWIKTQKRNVP